MVHPKTLIKPATRKSFGHERRFCDYIEAAMAL